MTPSPVDRAWTYEFTEFEGQPFPLVDRGGHKFPLKAHRLRVCCYSDGDGVRVYKIEIVGRILRGEELLSKTHYITRYSTTSIMPRWVRNLALAALRNAMDELNAITAYRNLGAG